MTDIQLSPLLKRKMLELTAYHEAGHAVIYILLGIPFGYVAILSDDGRLLGITYTPDRTINSLASLIISCAGKIAESEWGPHEEKLPDDFETSKDFSEIKRILEIMAHSEDLRNYLLYSVEKETKRILIANQKYVKNIEKFS